MRAANEDRLLALLGSGSAYSQADLVRASGLSASTVSVTVKRLHRAGQVAVETGTSNGRRATLVRATGGGRLAAGIDIGRTHVRILLGTSLDELVGDLEIELPERHAPAATIPAIARAVSDMVTSAGRPISDLSCVGVGLPGPVDEYAGVVTGGSILPTWVDQPVGAMLTEALATQVCLENDANLGAYAVTKAARPGVQNLLYVKIGTGIGAGVIVGGRLMQGSSGLAGELGHLPASPGGLQCRCGRRGCLETVASAESVRIGLSEVLERDVSNQEVIDLALSGASVARRVIEEAGEAVGRALAMAACLLDPGLIVLGGPLTPLGDLLLNPIRHSFDRHALSVIAEGTTITMTTLTKPPEAVGALMLGLKDPAVQRQARFL